MNANEVVTLITKSTVQDWAIAEDSPPNSGLSEGTYLHRPEVTLHWGATLNDEWSSDWISPSYDFGAPKELFEAHACIDARFAKSWNLVRLNRSRLFLPLPQANTLAVPREDRAVAQLIHYLTGCSESFLEATTAMGLTDLGAGQ